MRQFSKFLLWRSCEQDTNKPKKNDRMEEDRKGHGRKYIWNMIMGLGAFLEEELAYPDRAYAFLNSQEDYAEH